MSVEGNIDGLKDDIIEGRLVGLSVIGYCVGATVLIKVGIELGSILDVKDGIDAANMGIGVGAIDGTADSKYDGLPVDLYDGLEIIKV